MQPVYNSGIKIAIPAPILQFWRLYYKAWASMATVLQFPWETATHGNFRSELQYSWTLGDELDKQLVLYLVTAWEHRVQSGPDNASVVCPISQGVPPRWDGVMGTLAGAIWPMGRCKTPPGPGRKKKGFCTNLGDFTSPVWAKYPASPGCQGELQPGIILGRIIIGKLNYREL